MNQPSSDITYSVPPVERALKLLSYIGDGNTCRNFSAVARDLKINRTTLIRLIHTLEDHRMIEQISEGAGYRLGMALVSLGAQAIQGRDIVQICQPVLRELCHRTGMSAHLGILDGCDIIYLGRETPNSHLVSNVRAGSRLPAHAASIGRAILAAMSEDDVRQMFLGVTLEKTSDKTPGTIEAVIAQAKRDRELGYAWSEENFEAGIGSCAAVIFDHTGQPAGGLNVSGPGSRFVDASEKGGSDIREAVKDAARQASTALGHIVHRQM